MQISYEVLNGGTVRLRVYNVVGVCVRHLVDAPMATGAYSLTWNGTDDTGAPLSSGLYLVAVTEPNRVEIKKILVLKQ